LSLVLGRQILEFLTRGGPVDQIGTFNRRTVRSVATLVLLDRLCRVERRSPTLLPGATGTARSDHLILIGVFIALLINSTTSAGRIHSAIPLERTVR